MNVSEILQSIGILIGGVVMGAGGLAYRNKRSNGNGNGSNKWVAEVLKGQTDAIKDGNRVLVDIRDLLVENRGENRVLIQESAHTQRSLERLHERLDQITLNNHRST